LDDKLRLTPGQHDKIEKIIAEGQERNREIWTNAAPKMRKVMQEINQEIRSELEPGQQKKFEELVKRYAPHHGTNAPPIFPATNAPRD
jgi:TRAP-type C4-dicarboxylate transport system substrate-binding protein